MGNNVFIRFDVKNRPEMLVIQSEATPGSREVTRFVDGTVGGGVFLYEGDLLNDSLTLREGLHQLAELVFTREFDAMYDNAAAACSGSQASVRAVMANAIDDDGDREAADARQDIARLHSGWIAKQGFARYPGSGERRIRPCSNITVIVACDESGVWRAGVPELPVEPVERATRELAITAAHAQALRYLADAVERGEAERLRLVQFRLKERVGVGQ